MSNTSSNLSTTSTFCRHWEEQAGATAKGFGVLLTRIPQTCPWCEIQRLQGETTARLPTVEFMSGYVSARTDKAHWLGLLHDWFRHHANARGTDGRLLHPDLDVETQRELLKAESHPKTPTDSEPAPSGAPSQMCDDGHPPVRFWCGHCPVCGVP